MLNDEFDEDLHQEQMICFWKRVKTFYKNILKKCYDSDHMLENLSLWKALKKLSGKDITIIKLRVLYDNSFKEIGKVLGMTEGAVKMRYTRTIKLLRDIVEE